MSKQVFSCTPDDSLIQAEEVMRARQVRRLPVIDDDGRVVGVISLNDLAREVQRELSRKGREVSAQEVLTMLAATREPRRPPSLVAAA